MRRLVFALILVAAAAGAFAQTAPADFKTAPVAELDSYFQSLLDAKRAPSKAVLNKMVGALRSDEAPILVKERIAWALGRFDARSKVTALTEAAKHKSLLVRSAALGALIRMRARTGLPVYIDIANNDPVLSMRQKATIALGLLRWENAIDPLVSLSAASSPEVRGASVLAMAATHSNKNDFSELIGQEMTKDASPYVSSRAELGMDVIRRDHQRVRAHFGFSDPDIRLFAALFFHYHGRSADVPTLEKALNAESDDDVRHELERAIKGIERRTREEAERRRKAEEERKRREEAERRKREAAERQAREEAARKAAERSTSNP